MITQTITYEDYNGVERTEEFWFHLSKAELSEWNLRNGGTFGEKLQRAIKEEDWDTVVDTIQKIIVASYGRKSDDGRSFVKTQTLTENFKGTEAYSQLFMRLTSDSDFAAQFINGVVPKDVAAGMPDRGAQQAAMNREQRRAQPQDRLPKQAPAVVRQPVVQEDIVQKLTDTNDEIDAFQAWQKSQEKSFDVVPEDTRTDEERAAYNMGVTVEKYREFIAWRDTQK